MPSGKSKKEKKDAFAMATIRKSNEFVTAKFKTSILGNKIIAVSLTKLQDEGNQIKSVLYPGEIKKILGRETDTNIYKKLKSVSKKLAGHVITIEDGNGNFKTFSMITNVDYVNQELQITYNKEMSPYIGQLKGNYTTYELATLISFDKNYTYRLYEILKKEAYRINESMDGFVTKEYGVNELKCMIGLINTDATYISNAIKEGKSWDEVVDIAKKEDRQFDLFNDFKKRVLDVAQEEMEEKADIRFDYELERYGRGGKVRSIIFKIFYNKPQEEVIENIDKTVSKIRKVAPEYVQRDMDNLQEEEERNYQEIRNYLEDHGVQTLNAFTIDVFRKLYQAADESLGVIKREIDFSMQVPDIKNYYGWLLSAVRGRYSKKQPVETMYGSSQQAKEVKQYQQEEISEPSKLEIWKRFKRQEEYADFLEKYNLDEETLEAAYTTDELIKMYVEYKKRRKH